LDFLLRFLQPPQVRNIGLGSVRPYGQIRFHAVIAGSVVWARFLIWFSALSFMVWPFLRWICF
jgi:hypothetical protein